MVRIAGPFVGFEAVTLVPFEPKLIDYSLMGPEQIEWLNEYHALVVEKISPHFEEAGRQVRAICCLYNDAVVQ